MPKWRIHVLHKSNQQAWAIAVIPVCAQLRLLLMTMMMVDSCKKHNNSSFHSFNHERRNKRSFS